MDLTQLSDDELVALPGRIRAEEKRRAMVKYGSKLYQVTLTYGGQPPAPGVDIGMYINPFSSIKGMADASLSAYPNVRLWHSGPGQHGERRDHRFFFGPNTTLYDLGWHAADFAGKRVIYWDSVRDRED